MKEPAAATPSQDGFKNSATENVFKLIWNWIQFQAWLLKVLLFLPLCYIGIVTVCMILAQMIYENGMHYIDWTAFTDDETSAWAYIVHIFAIICAGFIAWHHENINFFKPKTKD